MKVYLGIDPGLQGALAVLDRDGTLLDMVDMPTRPIKDGQEVDARALYELLRRYDIGGVAIEEVGTDPHFGASRSFVFGGAYYTVLAVLDVLNLDVVRVRPLDWRKALLGRSTKGQGKEPAIQWITARYPDHEHVFYRNTPTGRRQKNLCEDRAEALCIAEYARQVWTTPPQRASTPLEASA